MDIPQFLYLNWPVGLFPVLAVANKVAINISVLRDWNDWITW